MKKERSITVKVIENNNELIHNKNKLLAKLFAERYYEKCKKKDSLKK